MEHWEEFMDMTGKVHRVKTLSDENFSYDSRMLNRKYLDISEYALAFYNNESDGEPIFAEATEMYIEDNDLYLTIDNDTFNILKDLKIKNVLEPSFSLQSHSDFYMYDFDSIEEIALYNLPWYKISTDIYHTICLKNINKNYIKSIISSIMGFSQLIKDYDREIMKDKDFISYKEEFIKNFKNDIDNFLKYNSLDWLYQTSSIIDEDFFFIAMFYDNITYVPEILREDFKEIYGGRVNE